MPKQIVAIHGGTTFDTYKEYISFLRNKEVAADYFKVRKGWKDSLAKKLGKGFEVFTPRMPNGTNARYEEWKIWFEKMFPFLKNGVVLIGHSLGAIFLAKYLAENNYPKKIKALILIAAPFENTPEESLADFVLPKSLSKITKQAKQIYFFNSKDDPYVPFEHAEKYQKALPASKLIVFTNKQHFNQETFPELIKLLKSI